MDAVLKCLCAINNEYCDELIIALGAGSNRDEYGTLNELSDIAQYARNKRTIIVCFDCALSDNDVYATTISNLTKNDFVRDECLCRENYKIINDVTVLEKKFNDGSVVILLSNIKLPVINDSFLSYYVQLCMATNNIGAYFSFVLENPQFVNEAFITFFVSMYHIIKPKVFTIMNDLFCNSHGYTYVDLLNDIEITLEQPIELLNLDKYVDMYKFDKGSLIFPKFKFMCKDLFDTNLLFSEVPWVVYVLCAVKKYPIIVDVNIVERIEHVRNPCYAIKTMWENMIVISFCTEYVIKCQTRRGLEDTFRYELTKKPNVHNGLSDKFIRTVDKIPLNPSLNNGVG